MQDIYLMNKETGELLPSSVAISAFHKSHSWRESWADEWQETDIETGSEMDAPDFTSAIRI